MKAEDVFERRQELNVQLIAALSTMEKKNEIIEIRQELKELENKCPHKSETFYLERINNKCPYCGKQF